MRFIDPHIHMSARTTDDYERMAAAGIVAVIEPAFWLGQPRTHVGTFIDYLSSLVGWERFRASQFGIRHYCTIGLNSKEANNEALAEQVIGHPAALPRQGGRGRGRRDRLRRPDRGRGQVLPRAAQLARELDMLVQVHTPHRDKKRGTTRSMDVAIEMGLDPGSVVIDHNNEETVEEVLDRGFWAAFTIYPETKMGNERMVEIARRYGSNRIFIDSSADWGKSDPLAVPKTARLMLERGIPRSDVEAICYGNALAAFGQSGQSRRSTGSSASRATSACSTSATRCCAASSRGSTSCRSSREHRRAAGRQMTMKRAAAPVTSGVKDDAGMAADLPAGAVYQQEFTIRYDYPVYFTERVFDRDNPVFEHALCRREHGKRHRFAAFIDANVAASWPALAHEIAAYAQAHGDTMELRRPPGGGGGGRACEERRRHS